MWYSLYRIAKRVLPGQQTKSVVVWGSRKEMQWRAWGGTAPQLRSPAALTKALVRACDVVFECAFCVRVSEHSKRFAEVDGRAFFCTPDVCEVEYGQIFEHTKGKCHMADLSEASECA